MKSWLSSLYDRKALLTARLAAVTDPQVDGLIASGQHLEDAGRLEEALARYCEAIELDPRSSRAHLNAGNAKKLLGDVGGALQSYNRAVELDPSNSGAHLNLGNALLGGRLFPDAERCYREALRLRPDWSEALVGLGCALEELKCVDEAAAAYRRALAINPDHAGAACNLSSLLMAAGDPDAARQILNACLEHAPDSSALKKPLVDMEWDAGRLANCVALAREIVESDPEDPLAHGIFLFRLNCLPEITPAEILAAHQRLGHLLESRVEPLPLPSKTGADPERRLRVGYVSPDLRRHPVANFVAPVLRHHDRKSVEVFCYYVHDDEDDVTAQLKRLADHWRAAAAWSDDQLVAAIRADQIDILVDLAGHTSENRIAVFARKPAPVQFTWLGYPETTGLTRVGYRLCDAHTDPLGEAEKWQTETPARMPESQWCYEMLREMPAPSPLPRLTRGYWMFGSFNNARKLNDLVFEAWAEILNSFPRSRLRLYRLQNKETEAWAVSSLGRFGIAPERVELFSRHLPSDDYFRSFLEIDVALDSFPYNGTTTTCECLLMGLPVLTVAGHRSISRVGISMMKTIGLPDWIADSEADLPQVAQRQLADPEAVAQLRGALPGRMKVSPLMDGPRFARNLEALYRNAWRRWCTKDGAA